MKFECDSCHAQYMIADEKVGKRGVKVKCKKCQHVIIVRPDGTPASSAKAAETKPVEVRAEKAETDAAPLEVAARPAMSSGTKKKAARIEEPQETLAQPPPPGLQLTEPPDDDDHGAFAHGGPTDPGVPEMKVAKQPPPGDDINFNDDDDAPRAPPPAPPPLDDDEPENTGPNLAPAPVSLFGDATQLTKNPMDPLASEPEPPRLDDGKTELGGLPQMTATPQGTGPDTRPSGRGGKNDATIVQAQSPPEEPSLPPPAPPPAPPPPVVAAPPMPAEDSALDDQLSGAFNNMFDPASLAAGLDDGGDGGDEHRGPTKVLDLDAMAALRKQSGGAKAGMAQGPDPRELFESGLVKADPKASAAAGGADDGPAEQVWHVAIDDQDVGPLSLAEVGRHIEGGRVDRESLVWKIGMDDWLPAGEVPAVRALFDKVPMPRIARVDDDDDRDDRKKKKSSFDMGPPIDDGLPEGAVGMGGGLAGSAPSPFDDRSDDDSWRPHGLTDVYQAANLAEAAGANFGAGGALGASIGASPMASSSRSSTQSAMAAVSTSNEPEWRPAAASALASLVQDEIKRLDQPGGRAGGPPPASDDDLSPADDASINAPLFGSLGANNIEAGPELGDPVAVSARSSTANGLPTFNQQQQQPPQSGFMSSPPAQRQGLSPALIAAVGGGAVVVVALVVVLLVVLLKGPDKNEIVMGPDGKPYVNVNGQLVPLGGDGKKTDEPVKIAVADKIDGAKKIDGATPDGAKKVDADASKKPESGIATPPSGNGSDGTNTAAGGVDGSKVASAGSDEPERASTPKAKSASTSPAKAAASAAAAKAKEAKSEEAASKPPPKVVDEKATPPGKGCDPVLDFDCKPGAGKSSSSKAAEAAAPSELKDKLSQADVLVVVKAHLGAVQGCGHKNKATGVIKMSWKIQPKGGVSDVNVQDSKFAGTPVGACVTSEIKGWKFPASKAAAPVPITFPMNLGS